MKFVLSNDLEIVDLLRSGDQQAMVAILEKYGDQLYSFIFNQLKSEQLASKALKRTITKVWKTSSEFTKAPEHLFIWLLMKAREVSKEMQYSLMETS